MSLHDDPPLTPDLLLRERRWLVGFARALVGASDAEDLAQETLVLALERNGVLAQERPGELAKERPGAMLRRGWLATAAKHLAANRWRSGDARVRREREVARSEVRPELDASQLAERAEAEQRVVEELLRLDDPYRETLLLRYQGGLSTPALACRLGVPAGTVRRRLSVGLGRLRERLDDRSGGRRAWAAALARPVTGTSIGTTSLGILAMNTKQLVGAALLLLVLAGGGLMLLRTGKDGADRREHTDGVPLAAGLKEESGVGMGAQAAPAAGLREELRAGSGSPSSTTLVLLDASGDPLVAERATLLGLGSFVELDPLELATSQVGSFTLLVRPEGHWPFIAEVELGGGELEVRATDGGRIEGLVQVEGLLPTEELRMRWRRDIEQQGFLHLDLEAAGWSRQDFFAEARVAADGHVEVRGLPVDWIGQVWAPGGHMFERSVLESIPVSLQLNGGAEQCFDLSRGFSVQGRFVDGKTGTPVAGVNARLLLKLSEGNDRMLGVGSDESGNFSFRERSGVFAKVSLYEVAGRYALPERIEYAFPRGEREVDLGDISLTRLEPSLLRIVDGAGRPVEDATLRAGANRAERGAEPGTWTVYNLLGDLEVSLVAWSRRHAKTSCTLRLDGGPLSLELVPGASLGLRVLRADGQSVGSRALLVQFDELAGQEWPYFTTEGVAGWSNKPSRPRLMYFSSDADGEGIIPGLPVGASGRVWERGLDKPPESAPRFGPLSPGETSWVELEVGGHLSRVTGTVRDENGQPLPGAKVTFRVETDEGARSIASTRAKGGGRFELAFEPTSEPLTLVASLGASFRASTESFSEGLVGDLVRDLRLERGRLVRYQIEDASGRPVKSERVYFRRLPEERDWVYGRLSSCGRGGSEGFVRGLGPGEIEIVALVGGVEHTLLHRTDQPEARIVVPTPGRVSVTLDGSQDVGQASLVLRDPVRSERWLHRLVSTASGSVFGVETVDPGIWEIALTDSFNREDPGAEFESLAGPVRIEVFAGRTTEVHLGGR